MRPNINRGSIWRVFSPILAYYGVYYFSYILMTLIGMTMSVIAFGKSGASYDYMGLITATNQWINGHLYELTLIIAVLMLFVLGLFRYLDKGRTQEKPITYEKVNAGLYLLLILLGFASCLTINGLMNLSGLMENNAEAEEIANNLYQGRLLMEFAATGFIVPIMEEILFRGLVQSRLKEILPLIPAIINTSVLFGLYHGNIMQMIYAFIFGLILSYVAEKYHSLLAPIIVHIAANWVSIIASETGIYARLMSSFVNQIVGTVIMSALLIGCMFLVHKYVNPKVIQKDEAEA